MTETNTNPSPRRRILLCLLGLLLGLVSVEALARWLMPAAGRHDFIPDKILGIRHAPSTRTWMTNEAREFGVWFETNSHGDPDQERTVAKPGNVYRVAVIGDSMVEAAQVKPEERFTSILERQLNDEANSTAGSPRAVEVLNFGTSSYGPAQEWLYYQNHVRQYSPDLVILTLLPGNDIRNSSYDLEVVRCERSYVQPFYEISDDGELRLRDDSYYENARQRYERARESRSNWYRGLSLYRILRDVYSQVSRMRGGGPRPAVSREVQVTLELFDSEVQGASPVWKEAWSLTEAILAGFASDVIADGSDFYVLVATGPWEIYSETRLQALETAGLRPEDESRFNWQLPHEMTNQMLTALGIRFSNVFPVINTRSLQSKEPLHFLVDGHYTPAGHRVVAGELLPLVQQYRAAGLAGNRPPTTISQ